MWVRALAYHFASDQSTFKLTAHLGQTYASSPYIDCPTQGLVDHMLKAYRQDTMWNMNATEVESGGTLGPRLGYLNQPWTIQQSAHQIMNTLLLQLTECLTSGLNVRSPETICRRMLCSTFLQRPLVHDGLLPVVPTLLSGICYSVHYQHRTHGLKGV